MEIKILDKRAGSSFVKNFGITITDKITNGFPNEFNLNFEADTEIFKINFLKEFKKYPDIYVIDDKGNPIKYGIKNPEVTKHLKIKVLVNCGISQRSLSITSTQPDKPRPHWLKIA